MIEAFRHIAQNIKMTAETSHVLENKTIYGRELTGTARIAKMNMILAGDGHTNITQEDTLKSPVKGKYNVVLTNFPFSQDTDFSQYYGLDTEDANPVFLRHILDACARWWTGRCGGSRGAPIQRNSVLRDGSQIPCRTLYDSWRDCTSRICIPSIYGLTNSHFDFVKR